MGAIGLNPIRLDAIGLDPIRFNAIRLGVPGASSATDRPYISPDVLSALVGVWISDGKSNTDPDRNIIKNKLPGRGGDFEILNAAYEGMSGCNGYPVVFGANKTWRYEAPGGGSSYIYTINDNKYNFTQIYTVAAWAYSYIKQNGELTDYNKDVTSFKIKVTGLEPDKFLIKYNYLSSTDATVTSGFVINSDGIYELPKSFANDGSLIDNYGWVGFGFAKRSTDIPNTITGANVTIEVLPEYEGAFVTDGVNDMIVSQNPVSEMLGGSNELTVVSMIHQITADSNVEGKGFTNYIRTSDNNWISNRISNIDKTGIYGYSFKQSVITVINNILGDKNDYTTENAGDFYESLRANFSVEGFKHTTLGTVHTTSVAWYWTFIAKRALTTDEINQVIAYFNLDKYVKPDIYYDVKKQGLTNDTPDEDWYLKDFSGNGRDMTLYNYAKTPESGINEEGGLQSDGVNDFGQFVGNLGLKDYTLIMNRAYNNLINNQVPLISSNIVEDQTPFIVEHWNTGSNAVSFSYGASRTTDIPLDINKKIVYQSTYSYMGYVIPKGNAISTGGGITLGKFGNGVQYSAICLWSLMLFPYSMSKFLIERQLKKYKLGTLYPNMVEFRPIVKSNSEYKVIDCYIDTFPAVVGNYYPINSKLRIAVSTKGAADEVTSLTVNGVSLGTPSVNGNRFTFNGTLSDKSPQKINITIDEYIRYEDIVQPYPVLLRFNDENGNEVSWGGKFRVGSTITRIGSAADSNLLPNIYNIFGLLLNDNQVTSYKVIVEKTMVFKAKSAYIFDNNEPKCILSPSRLRIPNSSYKLLGYIPDISGHGNNGVINNSAYAEGSGVNEDGSYQFDGIDDFVTIPTLSSGGKQVLMKVNWNTIDSIIYDQRGSSGFAIYCSDYNTRGDSITVPAYKGRNAAGTTYIDGIRNEYIIASQLRNVTHNIVEILDTSYAAGNINPIIGKSCMNANYGSLALYDFMLFDEISTDDKIKELNEYVGIQGNVWRILTQLSNSTLISNETLIKNE